MEQITLLFSLFCLIETKLSDMFDGQEMTKRKTLDSYCRFEFHDDVILYRSEDSEQMYRFFSLYVKECAL